MSLAYDIAKRINYSRGVCMDNADARGGIEGGQRVSRPAVRIAQTGVAIGLIVMLLTVGIVVGFKEEVRDKMISFSGHLTVQSLDPGRTYEKVPVCVSDSLVDRIAQVPDVESVRPFVTKPAVMKTDSDLMSIVVKSLPVAADRRGDDEEPRGVTLSETIAQRMRLQVGDQVRLYFIQQDMQQSEFELGARNAGIRVRTLIVDSLYQTHLSEIDQQMVLVPASLLQQVSGWDDDMYSGLEVTLSDFDRMESAYFDLMDCVGFQQDRRGTALYVRTIEEQAPQLFAWLALLDTNVWVILILIAVVAAFTTISGLMIIILERTAMIGVLKALGMNDRMLRRVFLWVAVRVVGRGLLWGNLIGLALCLVQWHWHVIALDPRDYYLEWVPIHLTPLHVVVINLSAIVVTLMVLLGPSALVAKISPVRAISAE